MCERYQRLAVSGWEHNRGRSKLREMKSDPIARWLIRGDQPYLEIRGIA